MNPVLILTCNNLELTKRCVESAWSQDIETTIFVEDNGSTDGTMEWLKESHFDWCSNPRNEGVSFGWNDGLGWIFGTELYPTKRMAEDATFPDHCLVVGNDTILAPWTYSALLAADVPFVTGVDVGMSPLPDKPDVFPLSPHPDFSCFLIRRECWEKVGPFDEKMHSYASDCDYHIRAHRLGIPLWKASVPYNHERSSTLNRATPQEKAKIQMQAHLDREVFKQKYGCLPGTAAYNALFEVPSGEVKA